ncbi:23S rRNA (guanine(1835)-N(2))-methyltransferase RlmG [Edwardsiella ictaluri]|uniref:23S rRNA (guanine(1835)-N(2))-methyltransferase RlmG n=1 Tax=Edwardsiella ictaluri TaxID=67780 RepID=UPI0009BD0C49|nr:23S rRNA (guanine(1835)-N(2))-methyltransferase RlmG [Edwardsiella ictaluri]ARD40218.1 23S rRNA (guanine(1835)-N(2))-methyltransferase [Edwardsiella ictaluri]QPW25765.1 23S rRNA (guanine(1835)-N(2))-methyltransferase RlmG [Edwardsiella ictaluri]
MSQLESSAGCPAITDLTLARFPHQSDDPSLQAWEAADEYLLQQIDPTQAQGRPTIIFNDAFGALACALHDLRPYSVSDSYVSQLATRHNLQLNDLDGDAVTLLDSLSPLPEAPALVVIKLPKMLALLEQQLHALRAVVAPDTRIIAAAKARDIHTSTLQLFESILGETHTSLAWKKARLIYCQVAERTVIPAPATTVWPLEGTPYTMHNHAGVFSRGSLDIGARFFLQHLPEGLQGEVADLGCGNGVLGLAALSGSPQARVLFADESYMAVASAHLNVQHNRPQDLARCEFWVGNGLAGREGGTLDAVLCNPPFHQQHSITDQVAWDMFVAARRCLKRNGVLYIVGNRHLDYYPKLRRLFGNCTTLGMNRKFVVLKAVKTV